MKKNEGENYDYVIMRLQNYDIFIAKYSFVTTLTFLLFKICVLLKIGLKFE
jgi:hypothetical protein